MDALTIAQAITGNPVIDFRPGQGVLSGRPSDLRPDESHHAGVAGCRER